MAKYKNADEILNKISDDYPHKSSLKLIQATPEDIASGDAEMCSLSFAVQLMEAEEKGKALMQKHDSEVKREVAKKIFEDIECAMCLSERQHRPFNSSDYVDYYDIKLEDQIAEVRAKYLEEEKGEGSKK